MNQTVAAMHAEVQAAKQLPISMLRQLADDFEQHHPTKVMRAADVAVLLRRAAGSRSMVAAASMVRCRSSVSGSELN